MRFRNGIIIGMVLFVGFIITLVLIINSKGAELTSEEYYLKEKSFDQEYEARKLAHSLNYPLKLRLNENEFVFETTDSSEVSDIQIEFSRMNNSKLDQSFKFKKLPILIPLKFLTKGKYLVKSSYEYKERFLQQDTVVTIR
jgi:hypothetical protein